MPIENTYLNGLPSKPLTPPFCDCEFPRSIDVLNNKNIHELYDCKCIENGLLNKRKEWYWDKESAHPETYVNKTDITFHPVYSQGTAFVRGDKRLEPNMIHYWEIQVITSPSGTDEMFGIGTDKVDVNKYQYSFVSGLGRSNQSWGYSYKGYKAHNTIAKEYGKRITQGCIIGIYLDLFRGHLEFYLNRKPLGIAYKNIPTDNNIKLYPMVCSTSSRCAIRLINSTSQPESLNFHAMRMIAKQPDALDDLKQMPGLKPLLEQYWFLIPSTRYSYRSKKNELSLDDDVVLSKRSKKLKIKSHDDIDDNFDINDIYENIKIPVSILENDEEHSDNEDMLLLL